MLLNEFFGSYNFKSKATNSNEELKVKNDGLCAEVLEYIINNDSLHKNVFFPIAEKIIKEATKEHKSDVWMPLANKGCMSFYKMAEMKDNPTKIFPEEFRKELCEKLAEHYQSDILKGLYKLGK